MPIQNLIFWLIVLGILGAIALLSTFPKAEETEEDEQEQLYDWAIQGF